MSDNAEESPPPAEHPIGPQRTRLPDTRRSLTHKFSISGHEGYITAGMFEDGTLGEVFIKMAKEGSTVSGLIDTIAVLISLCLQYGVSNEKLVEKFRHTRFEPSGWTNNPEIAEASSVVDYIFCWLEQNFGEQSETQEVEQKPGSEDILELEQ